jgi:hypothetical protein
MGISVSFRHEFMFLLLLGFGFSEKVNLEQILEDVFRMEQYE